MASPSADIEQGSDEQLMAKDPSNRRLRLVINGEGGAAQAKGGADRLKAELERLSREAALDCTVVMTDGPSMPGTLKEALTAARAGTLDAVVVGGGDGTIAAAAGIFADTGVPLGALPLGTVNHFAKDVGMPTSLDDALRALAMAEIAKVDLGEVNGRVFTNNAVLGVHPFMVAERDKRQRSHGWSKWPAMGWAFLKLLKHLPSRRLTLHVDGTSRNLRTPLVFVGVNDYRIESMDLRRSEGMANGNLWLLIARHDRPSAFVGFALRALLTGFDWEGDFEVVRARELKVECRRHHLPVTYNGELERLEMPLEFKLRPLALTILKPLPAPAGER
ncbi:Diacylglycerol kinase family enzyme [Arboricoccus pini]|uniref:Diacylglycerol kinase family enzyme n=1 Tax=Arboricoccus pini TaxID=1963835 RepID=A0A212QPR7_9PROT|nr:diacylglycerol kinase family protein [Arboricoccus pini]SNB61388.1 Diacylglycerol kinase family enzyme [Arboricoccus pini]